MRRGINIRKKKKIIFKELNKKSLKLLTLLFSILTFCIIIYSFFVQDIFIKINLEQESIGFSSLNENVPFSFKKIVLFSSATAESSSVNQLLSLDISQYCDIGIYLNTISNEEILISSIYIDNISIVSPEIGTPYLYKKSVTDFGKNSFDKKNIINNKFDFKITSSEAPINYNNYEIHCNGSTPFALGFYNENVKTKFIAEKSEILYNGTLLKEALIPLSSLKSNISFTINIITASNEHYICNINLDIPFKDEHGSIYDTGHITKELNNNETNKFIRIK